MRLQAEPQVLPERVPATRAAGADALEKNLFALESAGERLRAARRFVSDTLESLPEATLVADREGQVLLANRAAARLWQRGAPEELRGRTLDTLLSPFAVKSDTAQALGWKMLRELAQAPSGESGAQAALELAPHEGRDLLARCAACADAAGATAGWIVSLIDITSLREAERSRDEVLSFLSHDMRSPQSSILALLELHELDPGDNPKEAVHERIAQYARRTLELSEQFLQLARAENKEYELASVDLGMIAEEAIEEAWAAAEQKRIALKLRFDGEPVPVKADPALLRRALINLLTNAVKYSPEDTTTTVEVALEGGWAQCRVSDQGYGMSEDNLQNLFKRFRRFSRPGQPKAQGAGLGMAFVKTVAEKHGGRILVESQVGAGTRFTLQLPPSED
jgi:signal transduction histidine kinase